MIDRAAAFGATLAALWAAHDVADHVVQTDHQAAAKATSWSAMAGHVGSYHAVQVASLLALRSLGVRPSWRRIVAAVAWSAGTHVFLDRRWPVRRALELTGSPGFARGVLTIPKTPVGVETVERARERRQRDGTWGVLLHGMTTEQAIPVPLHGPYLADQALHHVALAVAAAILAAGQS